MLRRRFWRKKSVDLRQIESFAIKTDSAPGGDTADMGRIDLKEAS
jgi:hypothetical protein